MIKTKQTMLAQLIAIAVIFALFLLGIFVVIPGLRYLFILFIITNIVLGFINGKRNIPTNIIFIILTPSLFIPVLEYLATIILVVITAIHLLRFYVWYKDGGVEKKKEEKKEGEEEKKKFHIPVWLTVVLIIIVVIFILLVLIGLLFFSTTNMGG